MRSKIHFFLHSYIFWLITVAIHYSNYIDKKNARKFGRLRRINIKYKIVSRKCEKFSAYWNGNENVVAIPSFFPAVNLLFLRRQFICTIQYMCTHIIEIDNNIFLAFLFSVQEEFWTGTNEYLVQTYFYCLANPSSLHANVQHIQLP